MIRADSYASRVRLGSSGVSTGVVRLGTCIGIDVGRACAGRGEAQADDQIRFPTRAPARSAPAREHADAPAGGTVTPDRDAGQTHTAIDPTESPHAPRHAPRRSACVRPSRTAALDRRPRRTTPYHVADYSQEQSSPPQSSHSHCTAEARRRNPCNSCNRTPDSRNASYYDSPLSCRCPL